jgi:predicted house-cleaning NTP pyrophosphatase (Maf/HAM1 superfamily)
VKTYTNPSTSPSQTILVNDIGDQLGLGADEVMQAANAILKKVSQDRSRTTAMLSYLSEKHSLTNTIHLFTAHVLISPTEPREHTADR